MEGINKCILLALTIFLFVNCVSSDVAMTVEGITVESKGGHLICDSLWCSPDTAVCRVTKIFDPNDAKYFFRIVRCINSDGLELSKLRRREETGSFNKTITVTLEAGPNASVIFSDPDIEAESK